MTYRPHRSEESLARAMDAAIAVLVGYRGDSERVNEYIASMRGMKEDNLNWHMDFVQFERGCSLFSTDVAGFTEEPWSGMPVAVVYKKGKPRGFAIGYDLAKNIGCIVNEC